MSLPSVGRVVLYTLTQHDCDAITRRRTTGENIARRLAENPPSWPVGVQAHLGNTPQAGDVLPLIVTAVSDIYVSGQVMLDGTDTLWVQNVEPGDGAGQWTWVL